MIAIRNFMNVQIEQYDFLVGLFKDFDKYSQDWLNLQIEKEQRAAKEAAGGDKEIEDSIINPIYNCLHDAAETERYLFCQAMLLMAYAYYETNLDKIGYDNDVPARPYCICTAMGKKLSDESKKRSEFLHNYIRPLRNHIAHCNSGSEPDSKDETLFALSVLERRNLITTTTGYTKENTNNDTIVVCSINPELITTTLDYGHSILSELASVVGYKTIFIGQKD